MVAAESPLRLTFTLTERDVFQFMQHHAAHAPGRRRWLWALYAIWIIGPTLLVLNLDYELSPNDPLFHSMRWIMAAVTIPICAVGGLAFYWSMKGVERLVLGYNARAWSRQTNGVVGDWAVAISPDGVSSTSASQEGALKWNGVQRIVGAPDHLLFYQGRNYAQIIPRRAFASPEAAEEALRRAQAWHAAAMARQPG